MVKPVILGEASLSLVDLKEEVERIRQRDKEPGFRVVKTEEFLNQFAKLDKAKAEELKKRIAEIGIARLKPEHVNKILDLMPATADDVKLIFQGSVITITNENAKKIADIVKEYAVSKKEIKEDAESK